MPLVTEQLDIVAAGSLRIIERDVGFREQFGDPPEMRVIRLAIFASRCAKGPLTETSVPSPAVSYVKADPAEAASPEREKFYDVDYRAKLRDMIEHVVSIEGPIYLDGLVERLARAHGFQRSGETVQKVVKSALGRDRYPISRDGDRDVIWKSGEIVTAIVAYRDGGERGHGDVPLCELAGLARMLGAGGLDAEEIVRGMQAHFGLGRLAGSTRERFEAALEIHLGAD